MSRKEQLTARAHRYADAYSGYRFTWENGAYGFEDGYRAAMRDLRKLTKFNDDDYDPAVTAADRRLRFVLRVKNWLRPLR